jgi:hypothetical protein
LATTTSVTCVIDGPGRKGNPNPKTAIIRTKMTAKAKLMFCQTMRRAVQESGRGPAAGG